MTGAHWGILAAFAGFAVLVVLLRWRWPRLRATDAEPRGPEAVVEPQDRTAEVMFDRHVDDALVLLSERDQAIAEHTDKAMRRLTEARPLPIHRTEAGYPNCATCDGGGCLDCTDPA